MVNGALHFLAAARDFTLQRRNACLQLGDGQRIKVLPHELCQRIVTTGKSLVLVHGGQR